MRFIGTFLFCATLFTGAQVHEAQARTMEPGAFTVAGGVGPSLRLGDRLGGSRAYLKLMGQGEYNLSSALSIIGGVELGLAGTIPLQLDAGARYRLSGLDLPISPYGQAQLSYGRLYDVIGESDLTSFGLRLGLGADYFLTAKLGAGVLVASRLSRTTAEYGAFYGTLDLFGYATYTF